MFEQFLIDIGKYFLISSLIFFIVNNAFKTANYKRKAFIFLITGIILLLGMLIAHLVDRFYFGYSIFGLSYYSFPIAVIILALIIVSMNLFKAKKYNHHFRKSINYRRDKSLENFLYIVYKYEDNYYLNLENDLYSGDIVKFDRNVFFHDQMIDHRIEKLNLSVRKADLIGKVKGRNKRKEYIFYCYLVELKDDLLISNKFKKVDMFAIQTVRSLDFHKNIILRIIIKDNFEIEL